MKGLCTLLLMVALLHLAVGCQKAEQPSPKQYDVTGEVVAVGDNGRTITLDHRDIPGLMQAMTMEFKVDDKQVLERFKPGDQVHGNLEVRSGDYVITKLEKR